MLLALVMLVFGVSMAAWVLLLSGLVFSIDISSSARADVGEQRVAVGLRDGLEGDKTGE